MQNLNQYLIIIPAYNEEKFISQVINDTKKAKPEAHILVINDGSTDNTSEIARKLDVMVLDLPFNIGYGGAIQTGFRFAQENGYEFVITMDGDGQHDPYSINDLISAMVSFNADVVIGNRFIKGDYRMGLLRRIGAKLFSILAKLYTGKTFSDPTSGFQLLSRRVFSHLSKGNNYPLDYPDVNIIMLLHKMKFNIVETPVNMKENKQGKSMHSGIKPFIYVVRMLLSIAMVIFRKED